jgi:hypothetical protein
MKNIKQSIKISALAIIASTMTACGGGGKEIDVVKLMHVKIGKEFLYVDANGKIMRCSQPQIVIGGLFILNQR